MARLPVWKCTRSSQGAGRRGARLRARDLAGPQERRDAKSAQQAYAEGQHHQPQDRAEAAVKLADSAETRENKGGGHQHEDESDQFVPKSVGRFYDRGYHKTQEPPTLFVESRSVSINVTPRHNITMLSKVMVPVGFGLGCR
jgi:hypothetical protein